MARTRRTFLSDAAGSLLPISECFLWPRDYDCNNVQTELQGKVSPWNECPSGYILSSDAAESLLPISECLLWPRDYDCNNAQIELQGKVSPWHEPDALFYQMRLGLCFLFLNAFSGREVMTAIMCKLSYRVKFPHGTNPTKCFIRCGWLFASYFLFPSPS